jgi:hypothetical protein
LLKQLEKELEVLALGDPRDFVLCSFEAFEACKELVGTLGSLAAIARLAGPYNILFDIRSTPGLGEQVFERQFSFAAAIDAALFALMLLEVLPNGIPRNPPLLELLESIHDESELLLAGTGRAGNDLGVLPVKEVPDRFYSRRRHICSSPKGRFDG